MNTTIRNSRIPLQVESLEGRNLPSTVSYVQSLYTNLLNRTGSVPEVAGWEAEINLGGNIGVNLGVPAGQVTNAFVSSEEYLGDVIRNDYQTLLQRTPQPAEVQGWLQQLDNGLGQQQMEAIFLGSPEFLALHGNTNVGGLNAIYQTALGRTPDAAGLAAWTAQLKNGVPMQTVALDIVLSPEAEARVVDATYEQLLGRAPDAAGLDNWVAALEQGLSPAQMAAQIAASPEYINLKGGLDFNYPQAPQDGATPPTGNVGNDDGGFIDTGDGGDSGNTGTPGYTGGTGGSGDDTGDTGNTGDTGDSGR